MDIPAAARKHTEAGAEAFVKFFVEQSNVASMRADTTILPSLSVPECQSCQRLQGQVEDLKAKGHHYKSAPVTVSKVTAVDGGQDGQQFVRLQMTQNPAAVVDTRGKTVSTDPRAELARTTSLVWVGERWLIFGIAQ
jgi:hypothetical protein